MGDLFQRPPVTKMQITAKTQNNSTTLYLDGRLDIDTCSDVETAIRSAQGQTLLLDLRLCPYISSAGLRVMLSTQKAFSREGKQFELINVPKPVIEILDVTGLKDLLTTRPIRREINLEECEFLSAGVCGECFRMDPETIVKVYREGVSQEVAEQEKQFAKAAFMLGIPTAISYDVVSCGTRTGVVYEMLNAGLLSEIIASSPEKIADHARTLAGIAKQIHSIKGDKSGFPDIKQKLRGALGQMESHLPGEDVHMLLKRLENIPDDDHCLHFDLHSSNIMIKDGEPLLLDLGDFSTGSYLFEIGVIAAIYSKPSSGVCQRVTKLPGDLGLKLFNHFCESYFANKPPEDLEFFRRNFNFLQALRPMFASTFLPSFGETWIPRLRDELLPLIRAER